MRPGSGSLGSWALLGLDQVPGLGRALTIYGMESLTIYGLRARASPGGATFPRISRTSMRP